MSDNFYNIQWKKLTRWLTRHKWRTPKHLSLLYALTAIFNDLHSLFLQYKGNVRYRLGLNYQVCYMEKALNDRYDVADRRIVIVDAPEYKPMVLFRKSEVKKVVLNRKSEGLHKLLFTKSETAQYTVDFVVRVPMAVPFTMAEMVAFVKTLHVPGVKFKIQIV